MPVRLLLLLICLGSLPLQAPAQAYEPGWVVRSNGDTLRGEVENGFWKEPPTFIRFRPSAAGPSELFKPRQLRALAFAGGRYFRYEALPIDHAAETRLDRLPQGFHPNVQMDSVLAEVLLDGPALLLRVPRVASTHYLLRRPGQPYLDLCERKYLRKSPTGALVVAEGNNFRSQLGMYFGDCPAASQVAATAAFTPEDLIGVVQAYNESCAPTRLPVNSYLQQAAPRRTVALLWGLLAGGRYDYAQWEYLPKGRLQPFGGAYAELLQPSRRLALFGELTLSRFHGEGSTLAYHEQVPFQFNGQTLYREVPVYSSFTFRTWLATARMGLRFFYPLAHEQQLFWNFGFDLSWLLRPEATITAGPVATPAGDDFRFIRHPIVPSLGLGWRRDRLSVGAEGQLYGPAGPGFGLRLGLGYRLGRNPDEAGAGPTARP